MGGTPLNAYTLLSGKNLCLPLLFLVSTSLAACQGAGSTQTAALETAAQTEQQTIASGDETADATQPLPASDQGQASVATDSPPVQAATTQLALPAQCTIQLAGGPPAKPPRGADFGQAVAKNTGKAIQRSVIQQIGGAVAGGLGAAIAGGVAQGTIRQEEDIKGVWMITDGNPACACEISVDSLWKLKGKGADSGFSKNRGCSSPVIKQVAAWTLGYSFTGYDSKFELKAKDKTTILGTLNRDGIHYFSGTLADGTPVVMWRERQTYNQLTAFNKSVQ